MTSGVTDTPTSGRPPAAGELAWHTLGADQVLQVRSAIGKLKDTHRQVIELAYFEGLSQTEIAARISQPLGTVKTWMRTGLKLLRDELDTKVPA